MAIARKCDRCGSYRDGRIYTIRLEPPNWTTAPDEKDYDLCAECTCEFYEFMDGVKPKNLVERLISKLRKD